MADESAPPGQEPGASEVVDGSSIGRRHFLQWVSGIGAAVIGVLVGVPVIRAFLSPALSTVRSDSWVKVADDVTQVDTGVPLRVNFVESKSDAWMEDRQINGVWLYTEDGKKVKAYNAHCTHLGCAYGYNAETQNFACPCHRGQFDVKTGQVLAGPPPRPLDELKVEIRNGAVWVDYKDFRLGTSTQIEA
jgi:menaquinol-cytochrome c reductase iron-sulfur subunit